MAGATLSLLGGNGIGDVFTPTEAHKQLREMVRSWSESSLQSQATQFNREEKFNVDLFRSLGEMGLLGITADPDFGGSGMDATGAVIAHEEMAAVDPAFTLSYLAHSMLFVNNLNVNGSKEQKARYLPTACTGKTIGGMCMSEPAAGTDVLGMRTRAVRQGDSYVISGQKMWITNGAIDDTTLGDHFLVYARTGEKGGASDLSLFLVEKGMPGFSLGQRIKDKCGMRASCTAELVFDGVKVPGATHLVGGPSMEGRAVYSMMRNLEIERLTLAAMSLGIARKCVETMIRYSNERTAFGQPISRFGQIQKHIADSYAEYQAGRAYVYSTAHALKLDSGGNRVDSDGVKLYCSVMAKNVADRAIQTLGGYGYVGEYNVERLWRDAKLLEIGGGTLEAHEKNMARDLSSVTALP